jgi:DNA repair ATPase RecN
MAMTPPEARRLIEEKLANAANFRKVDLHIHSDESPDFPREHAFGEIKFTPTDIDNEKPVAARHFIKSALNKKLDLIAITDHMRSRKACEIAMEKSEGLVCLPGIEVNIRISQTTDESIHFICIFKEGKSSEDIERIFTDATGLPNYYEREVNSKIFIDISKFVRATHENDGICIACHVNDERGLRKAFYDTDFKYLLLKRELKNLQIKKNSRGLTEEDEKRLKVLEQRCHEIGNQIQEKYLTYIVENEIDAVQVQKSSDFQFYIEPHTQPLNIPRIAAILSSDAHCLGAIGCDNKITYVKMAECNFENLKSALRDPQTRIRYSDNVKTHNYSKIKGLIYLGEDGFFKPASQNGKPQVLGFADNLTCFIGGRGSGKSATVDALRYIFKDKKEIESLRDTLKRDVFERAEHTLSNTSLYVLMQSADRTEVIVNIFYQGWGARNYESRFMDGTTAEIDLSTSTEYRVEIYGWSEIEDLGTDPDKQRQLLDKFIREIQQIQRDILETKRKLEINRADIVATAKKLEDMVPEVKNYQEAKAAFDKINTAEMQALFKEIDAITEKQARLKKLKQEMKSMTEKLDISAIKGQLQKTIREIRQGDDEETRKWVEEALQKIFEPKTGQDVLGSMGALLTALQDSLEKVREKVDVEEDSLYQRLGKLKNRLPTGDGVGADTLTTIEKRSAYKQKYDALKTKKEQIEKVRTEIGSLCSSRNELLERFVSLQRNRSEKRSDKKDEINDKLEKNIRSQTTIKIDFNPLGERKAFEDKLGIKREGKRKEEGILKGVGPKYMDRRFAETISEHMTPKQFVKTVLENNFHELVLRHSDGENYIDEDDAKKIIDRLQPKTELYGEKYYEHEKLEVLLRLEEIEYEDLPEIKLNAEPIMGLSPGSRCSALLPIILLQGDFPLIIDQPEDNLDNKLVFDLVVDILRSLKEFRQIIVATHNPNIPVSGDAEQIILFESIDKYTGKAEQQGSIDNDIMISRVKEVMEGGDLAFHTRAQKYRYTP